LCSSTLHGGHVSTVDVDGGQRVSGLRRLDSVKMQQTVRAIVPKLTDDMQKGQCGRIGIFGGCIM
jgi:hypothetical protein